MTMKLHEKRTYIFLLILTVVSTIAFQLWRTLFNNFSVEVIGIDSASVGLVQAVREIPGFLAFFAVYITLIIKEKWLAFLSVLIMSIGVGATGYFPTEWGLIWTTLFMSIGFHYFETINQSLSMQYFSNANFTLATANLRRYGALAAIFSGVVITALTKVLNYQELYLVFGMVGLIGAFAALKFLPEEDKVAKQQKGLVLKKKYWVFYALTFLNGARRQIFTVFALFLLVERHGVSAATVSTLFILNNVVNFFIYPYIAKSINRWGEQSILRVEYISLITVFLLYAAIDYLWMALALYILDNLCYAFSMATKSYFQKIAETEDLAPTAGVSFTINHIAAVIVPFVGGLLWLIDWRIPFVMGACIAFFSLLLTRFVKLD